MIRALRLLVPACAAASMLALAPAASAAKAPAVTSVSPMKVKAGGTLTIKGRRFSSRRTRNTVILRSPSGRALFVKPRRARRTRLVITIPTSIERFLSRDSAGKPKPTRFRLKVLAGKFSKLTTRGRSPVIYPRAGSGGAGGGAPSGPGASANPAGDCDKDGITNGVETDDDGDLLLDSREATLATDACLRDTDGDGIEDGYEVEAALDVNSRAVPYPGRRPFPNALDPGDAGVDYDGDGLEQLQEWTLFFRYSADGVRRPGRPTTLSNLLYSDGRQSSFNPPLTAPAAPLLNWALDWDEDGVLTDDERDGDADGLGNWDEANGRMTEAWWPKQHNGEIEPQESKYPEINFLDTADLPLRDAYADPDLDGDGVLDGADDNDHDGLSNQFEVRRPENWDGVSFPIPPATEPTNPWAYTNPFNPCKPFNSDRCHRYIPFGYYESDERPPVGPNPPPGFPGSAPATPAG